MSLGKILWVLVVEQYNTELDKWNPLLELDPMDIPKEECCKRTKPILQDILSSDVFIMVRESDGCAVTSMHSHGPVRIKWKSKLERKDKK